jgi:hypothetical protein
MKDKYYEGEIAVENLKVFGIMKKRRKIAELKNNTIFWKDNTTSKK